MKEWSIASIGWLAAAGVTLVSPSWLIAGVTNAVILAFFWLISKSHEDRFGIYWRAWLIGVGTGVGLIMARAENAQVQQFGMYVTLLSCFHISEFVLTTYVATDDEPVSTDSFLLNQSLAYGIASIASVVEFVVEAYCFPDWKSSVVIEGLGLAACFGGEMIRKLAILTAGSNFNHVIQTEKKFGHELVTTGLYAFCRHPSYVGWFMWAVGTQVLLQNPVCIVCYILASWRFFQLRILEEELTLLRFFGKSYRQYQLKVPTGLPFIQGYMAAHPVLLHSDH